MAYQLTTTAQWIAGIVPDVLIPPQLWRAPERGWLKWAADLSGEEEAGENTISGNMIENDAPGWAQWIALQAALSGQAPDKIRALAEQVLDPAQREQAAAVRQGFEAGRPLPVALSVSVERFVGFVPVVRRSGEGQYAVGGPTVVGHDKSLKQFRADDAVAALGRAAQWFDQTRLAEFDAQKQRAKEATAALPPIYLDLAALQLGADKFLMTEDSQPVALQNGAHGFYRVESPAWCYTAQMGTVGAARLGVLGTLADKRRLALRPDETPDWAELEDWQEDEQGGFRWADGTVEKISSGLKVVVGGETRGLIVAQEKQVDVYKAPETHKPFVSSALPESVRQAGLDAVAAWGVWRLLRSDKQE